MRLIHITVSNRLQEQLNAEMRIQEGDLGNRREDEFFGYFIHIVDKAHKDFSDLEKRKAREHLCAIFQV